MRSKWVNRAQIRPKLGQKALFRLDWPERGLREKCRKLVVTYLVPSRLVQDATTS